MVAPNGSTTEQMSSKYSLSAATSSPGSIPSDTAVKPSISLNSAVISRVSPPSLTLSGSATSFSTTDGAT